MKQFKAITVDGEMALQELPQMLQPLSYSNDEWDEYLRLLAIIKVAPEYKDFWKEGEVVRDDEFEINQFAKVKEGTKWVYEGAVLRVLDIRPFGQFEEQYGDEYKLCLKGTKWEMSYKNPCTFIYQKDLEIMSFAIPKPKEDEGEALAFSDLLEMANLLPPEQFMHYAKQHYSIRKLQHHEI